MRATYMIAMSPLRPESTKFVRCQSVLTPASGFLTAFTHTLNPYMGCAFGDGGCGVHCYVAESPNRALRGPALGPVAARKAECH